MKQSTTPLFILLSLLLCFTSCSEEAVVNVPPTLVDQTYTLGEDAAPGTMVGTVLATDADGDLLTYRIVAGDPDSL